MRIKKSPFLTPLIIYLLLFSVTVPGAYWIWSNTVNVTVEEYSLTLSPTDQTVIKYQYANITATLKLNGVAVEGKTIYLYFVNGTFTGIMQITNSTGQCLLQWNATSSESLKARMQAP